VTGWDVFVCLDVTDVYLVSSIQTQELIPTVSAVVNLLQFVALKMKACVTQMMTDCSVIAASTNPSLLANMPAQGLLLAFLCIRPVSDAKVCTLECLEAFDVLKILLSSSVLLRTEDIHVICAQMTTLFTDTRRLLQRISRALESSVGTGAVASFEASLVGYNVDFVLDLLLFGLPKPCDR
jgi:hypothetical protein